MPKQPHSTPAAEPENQTANTTTQPEIVAPAASVGQISAPQSNDSAKSTEMVKKDAAELTDADKERIRNMVTSSTGRRQGLIRLPDGSARMDVTIPVEIFLMLESQAECAQEPLESFIQRNVVDSLMAYVSAEAV